MLVGDGGVVVENKFIESRCFLCLQAGQTEIEWVEFDLDLNGNG